MKAPHQASQSVGKTIRALSALALVLALSVYVWRNRCGIYLYFRSFILRQYIKTIESFEIDLVLTPACSQTLARSLEMFCYKIHDRNHTITTQNCTIKKYNSFRCIP